MMQFNLLPYRVLQQHRRRQFFFGALLLSALLGSALAGIGWHAIGTRQQVQLTRNRWLQHSSDRLEADIKQAAVLQLQIDAVQADIGKIKTRQRQRDRTSQMLATLAAQIPPDVTLHKMRQQDSKITLDGVAASNRAVTQLLQNLNAQADDIASAQLLETRANSRPDGQSLAFSVALTLRPSR
jgi:type IV pilus assembly protein PilN